MAGALSVTPVRPYLFTYVRTYIRSSVQRHIVKYHDFFFKFDNGPYCTMLSVVMALCLENSSFETMSAL